MLRLRKVLQYRAAAALYPGAQTFVSTHHECQGALERGLLQRSPEPETQADVDPEAAAATGANPLDGRLLHRTERGEHDASLQRGRSGAGRVETAANDALQFLACQALIPPRRNDLDTGRLTDALAGEQCLNPFLECGPVASLIDRLDGHSQSGLVPCVLHADNGAVEDFRKMLQHPFFELTAV